jgi:hypothetical protein
MVLFRTNLQRKDHKLTIPWPSSKLEDHMQLQNDHLRLSDFPNLKLGKRLQNKEDVETYWNSSGGLSLCFSLDVCNFV